MGKSFGDFLLGGLMGLLVGGLAGLAAGHPDGRLDEQHRAVKAGVARWAPDPRTGAATFEYLKPGEGR